MAKHLYLPTLRPDANVRPPSREGHWESSSRKILRQVSDGISVGAESAVHGVSSVPDVWARPLMFKSILAPPTDTANRTGAESATSRGREHPLWRRMTGEWRGLLSLLALRDIKKYSVEIVPVSLGRTEFESALRGLAPPPVQLEHERAYPWTEVFLIKWDNVPVGALSPSTLVYTGTAYNKKLAARAHTLIDAEGYLRAPTGLEESRQVQAWVASLRNDLKGDGKDVAGLLLTAQESAGAAAGALTGALTDATAILRLLATWLDELSHELAKADVAPLNNVVIAAEPIGISDEARPSLAPYRVYQRLLRPLEADKSAAASDMALKPNREPAGAGQVVVITRHLLETNRLIWGNIRLADRGMDADRALRILFNGSSGSAIGDLDLRSKHAIWIRPEKYFLSDTLTQSAGGSRVLSNAMLDANLDARFVLPFRREILDYFSPSDIVKLLRPSYRETGNGITFSFTLPVGAGPERIERTYRAAPAAGSEDGTLRTIEVPLIEIFPDYVNESWRRYYVFQTDADTVTVAPIAIGSDVIATQRTRKTSRKATADAVRIWSLSGDGAFPQAVQLASPDGNALGLILLDHEDGTQLSSSRKWQVGVDFGTSNTQVFYAESDDDRPKPMSFDFDRKRSLTESDARRESIAHEHFVPAGVKALPIPTTLRLFNRVGTPELLLDRLIYFSRAYDLPDDVVSDMKWDDTASGPAKLFLGDLVFLILLKAALEGVGELRMRWSYPKAFSSDRQNQMNAVWQSIMGDLLDGDRRVERRSTRPGTTLARTAPYIPDPVAAAEGIAAGYYFASERTIQSASDRADIGDAAVTLDVGGGTTDISIWDHENIVLDASILLAGRQIVDFIRSGLMSGSDFLSDILSSEALTALEAVADNPVTFAARLNLVLTEEGDALRVGLGRNIGPEARRLRQLIALEFAAITFYASMLLGSAARRSGSDLREKVGRQAPRFHWGGNASKFLHWVDLGGYLPGGQPPEARAESLLRVIGFYGLKDAMPRDGESDGKSEGDTPSGYKELRHSLSPGHKSEAAGGLVVMPHPAQGGVQGRRKAYNNDDFEMDDDGQDSKGPANGTGTICGEDIELQDGSQLKSTDSMSESLLFAGDRSNIKRITLNRLTRFIEVFNRSGIKFGLLNAGEAIDIARMAPDIEKRVRAHYVSLERLPVGERTIEPVFIVEVRTLLSFLHG